MSTNLSLDELQAALRVLDNAALEIDQLIATAVRPEPLDRSVSDEAWLTYRCDMNMYYGTKNGLQAALDVIQQHRRHMAREWDNRHVHAPAQFAAARLKGQ
jgi:hypothetical protein